MLQNKVMHRIVILRFFLSFSLFPPSSSMYFGNKADKEVTNCSLSLKAQSAFFHSLSLKSQETCRETNEEAFSFWGVYDFVRMLTRNRH